MLVDYVDAKKVGGMYRVVRVGTRSVARNEHGTPYDGNGFSESYKAFYQAARVNCGLRKKHAT